MKSASDVYFGAVRSAISIEPESNPVVRTVFRILAGMDLTLEDALAVIPASRYKELAGVPAGDLASAISAYFEEREANQNYSDRRFQEFSALARSSGGAGEDLWVEEVGSHELEFAAIRRVYAVRKLREVRALVGFQRGSMPLDPSFEGESAGELSVRFGDKVPAYENRGEGIFFEFSPESLREWTSRADVAARARGYLGAEKRWRSEMETGGEAASRAIYVLAHSFAHLLIRELSLHCGYSQSSLRERIFASGDDAENPWAGVLIYTSSSDADGSLGGLVFQAIDHRLKAIVRAGYEALRVCSSDPVCALQEPEGFRKLNGAACHSCLVLPETCCERNNRFLDRNMVVPSTLREPENGLYCGLL